MGNPFEFREIMKASFHFNETRSVDEVVAEHEANHKNRNKKTPNGVKAPDMTAVPSKPEMDKLKAMMLTAKPSPASPPE